MEDWKELIEAGKTAGFSQVHEMDVSTIELLSEVRDMCAANTCGQYGAKWSCPPGCGTLEECEEKVRKYTKGLIVQTVGEVEDSLDYEAMMEIEKAHKKHFADFLEILLEKYPKLLPISAGCCTQCKECTYPDAPCRFPHKAIASMEAYGMVVNEVCKKNGVAYNYGPEHMAYTSCYLLY